MEWVLVKDRLPEDEESNLYQVFCAYPACKEQNVAYLGDNDFFYSEETDKLLPVTHWKDLDKDSN